MKAIYIAIFLVLSCQQKPTKVMQETVDAFAENTVLVDTRNAFDYASFYIPGSVNLSTSEFLVLKNPLTKRRVLDPDIKQTIERLARRGITPQKRVVLISDKADSVENKKWQWLLRNLEVENVSTDTIEAFRKKYPNRRFAEPARESVWSLETSEELQNEFIFKKSSDCFVSWSEKKCNKTF